jgi:hypothetical protein
MANVVRTLLMGAPYFEVLPSAARTASPDTQEFRVDRRGVAATALILTIDVTAVTATPALTVTINRVDPVSGKVTALLASAVIATVSTTVLKVGPDLAAATNLVAQDYMPPCFRIDCSHGDADSITYSVGGMIV